MASRLSPLTRHLTGAGFAVFFVTLSLAVAAGALFHLNRTFETVLATQRNIAILQARAAEDYLTHSLGVIDLTLQHLVESQIDPTRELSRAVRHAPYLRSLSLLDEEGRVIASSNPANVGTWLNLEGVLPPLAMPGEVMRFGAVREGRDLVDSHPIGTSGTDPAARTFFTALRTLPWQTGEARLVAAINTDYYVNHFDHSVNHQQGIVEVFLQNAILLLSTDGRRRPGLLDTEALPFRSGILPEQEIGSSLDAPLDGEETLAAFRASRRYPLVVVMYIPRQTALVEWRKDRDSVLQFVLPTLVVLILLGALTLNQWRRSIAERRLAQAAARESQELRERVREKEIIQEHLQKLALLDPLTGLYNRRYLNETASLELAQAREQGNPLSLVILDIDHFKQVNDRYGHPAGDQMLVALADLLRAHTRPADILCRTGGEEFLLLLNKMPLEAAVGRAETLRQAFAQLAVPCGDQRIQATLSLGIASYPNHADYLDGLIQLADEALYLAKRGGRNRVEVARTVAGDR